MVACALAGYLVALAATPTGQGLRLAGHVAAAHHGPTVPALASAPGGAGRVLPTLRDVHRHGGGAAHTHGHEAHEHGAHTHGHGAHGDHDHGPSVHRSARPVPARATPPVLGGSGRGWGGEEVHEHDGVLHSHGAPAPEPAVVVTVSLDKHRLTEAPPVPGPPSPTAAPPAPGGVDPAWVDLSVETPPPLARG